MHKKHFKTMYKRKPRKTLFTKKQKRNKRQYGNGIQKLNKPSSIKTNTNGNKPFIKPQQLIKKPTIVKNIPKLSIDSNSQEDIYHIYLNLLIDLMGSSLYDAFIEHINKAYNLQIQLNAYPSQKFDFNVNNYIRQFDKPCIFYKTGGDYTHFICTYDKSFSICDNKISPKEDLTIGNVRTNRNPCKANKFCLWDPYYNVGGFDCTIYGGLQKQSAHSFCQTFTLSCMINQYLPNNDFISYFALMENITGITDLNAKNEFLCKNAFYAKQIACKIVRFSFDNNLSLNTDGVDVDCWDFLYEQVTSGQYNITPQLNYDNYKLFMDNFLNFCERITIEQFKNSTIIENIIY